MMLWRLLPLCLLIGCGTRKPEQPDAIFQHAQRELRLRNLDAALTAAGKGLDASDTQPDSTWHWRFLLLKAEVLVAKGEAAEALKLLSGKVPMGPAAHELTARLRMNQGYAKLQLSQFQESKRLLDEARRIASEVGSPALVSEVELRRGASLTRLHESAAADASFQNALENARRAADPYLEIAALGNLGAARMFTYRYDEAIPYFERILPLAQKANYPGFNAKILHNLGICYKKLGDEEKALQLLSQAEPMYAKFEDLPGLEGCLGDLGTVHVARGDYQTAILCLRKALALARQLGNTLEEGEWLNNLAATSLEAGDLSAAGEFSRQAIEVLKSIDPHRLVEARLNSGRIAEARNETGDAEAIYRQAIQKAGTLGMPDSLIEGHARLGSLFARSGNWPQANRQFGKLAASIEQYRSGLDRDEWKLTYQSSVIPFYEDFIDLLMARGRINQALQLAESCRARVLAEKLGFDQEPSLSAKQTFQQKASAENAILLSYWVAPRRSFLWVITARQTRAFVLPPEKEIRSLVEAYGNVIQNIEDTRETVSSTGRRLYQELVAPAADMIPSGSSVILVPDGPLYGLNFETLLSSGEPSRYWLEDVTIASAPSLDLLGAGRGKTGPRSLLLIGDPVSPDPDFPPLPDTETEIKTIAGRFPAGASTVIKGAQANPGAYEASEPARFSLIHFSAHAVANRENPLDSAVILSRKGDSYKLYARDVTAIPLRADLVTISACRSAGARLYAGEGLVGFSWAFLQAGARNVIAGLWDVSDRSTARLMDRLYEELAAGKTPARALRAAKLAFLTEPTYRRPYYWAPFELFTRGAPFRVKRIAAKRHY